MLFDPRLVPQECGRTLHIATAFTMMLCIIGMRFLEVWKVYYEAKLLLPACLRKAPAAADSLQVLAFGVLKSLIGRFASTELDQKLPLWSSYDSGEAIPTMRRFSRNLQNALSYLMAIPDCTSVCFEISLEDCLIQFASPLWVYGAKNTKRWRDHGRSLALPIFNHMSSEFSEGCHMDYCISASQCTNKIYRCCIREIYTSNNCT